MARRGKGNRYRGPGGPRTDFDNPDNHVPAVIEVPGDAPHCFEIRCTCGYWSHTHAGIGVAEEVAIRHFFMATGILIERKEVRQ